MLFRIGCVLKDMWYFSPVLLEITKKMLEELGLVMKLVLFRLMRPVAFSSVLVSIKKMSRWIVANQ